jgi:transposase-like protein
MGEAKRNRYTKEFKFKVALEAIKGEKQLAELSAEFKVHPTMISTWKRQLLEKGAEVFDAIGAKAEIGHQQVKIDWMKKKLGISDRGRGVL